MTTAIVTIVAGRHSHLSNQQRGLLAGDRLPDVYIVVAMGDAAAVALTETGPLAGTDCVIRTAVIGAGGDLPLAAARNAGAALALASGATVIVFLDVDCVPSASLVRTYTDSVLAVPATALHCGVVRYLGADIDVSVLGPAALVGPAHAARPAPEPGARIESDSWQLFWSLSFAVSADTWRQLGGFCEEYVGYGAEDTDLGYLAHLAGVKLIWVGGADAFHQYHPTTQLPTAHLRDIMRNAAIFHRRWGFWPMQGWLTGFQQAGLAEYDAANDSWQAVG